jgi:hypothetical protein
MFVQKATNDPAAILRIRDTRYYGIDTSSVMSAANEFTTKNHRPCQQHMEMFLAEFERLAMRLKFIGHDISEKRRVVNFLNSLSEVSTPPGVLSTVRVTDDLTKATTQILLRSELLSVSNNGPKRPERAIVANNGFSGTIYTCGYVCHRSSYHFDHGRHQSRHLKRRYEARCGEDITLIVARKSSR